MSKTIVLEKVSPAIEAQYKQLNATRGDLFTRDMWDDEPYDALVNTRKLITAIRGLPRDTFVLMDEELIGMPLFRASGGAMSRTMNRILDSWTNATHDIVDERPGIRVGWYDPPSSPLLTPLFIASDYICFPAYRECNDDFPGFDIRAVYADQAAKIAKLRTVANRPVYVALCHRYIDYSTHLNLRNKMIPEGEMARDIEFFSSVSDRLMWFGADTYNRRMAVLKPDTPEGQLAAQMFTDQFGHVPSDVELDAMQLQVLQLFNSHRRPAMSARKAA